MQAISLLWLPTVPPTNAAIALGIFAGLVNLPVNENDIRRPGANPQPA
jgi:hypothetical protein